MDETFDFDAVDFVTADTHFGHGRILDYAQRPFSSVEEMDRELHRRWNAVVGENDVVLHLGDLALGPVEGALARTAELNGKRFLVPGNHDRISSVTQSTSAIERFAPIYEASGWTLLPEVICGHRRSQLLLASHYPYHAPDRPGGIKRVRTQPVDAGLPLLHGHTHERNHGPHGHEFHVGVDANDFAPLPFSAIDRWLARLDRVV